MTFSSAALLVVEPEPDAGAVYKIRSDNHSHRDGRPTHRGRIPATDRGALTSNNWCGMRHGCKISQKRPRHVVWKRNVLEKRAKRAKKKIVKAVQRIFSCGCRRIVCEGSRAIEERVEELCSRVCSMLTGLTGVVIDIAYLYTHESQSHSQPTEPVWWPPAGVS